MLVELVELDTQQHKLTGNTRLSISCNALFIGIFLFENKMLQMEKYALHALECNSVSAIVLASEGTNTRPRYVYWSPHVSN